MSGVWWKTSNPVPFRFKSLAGIQKGMGEENHNEGILMHVYMRGALLPGDPTNTLVSKLLCADSLVFLSTKASPLKRCEEMSTQGGLFLNNNSFSAGINCDLQLGKILPASLCA